MDAKKRDAMVARATAAHKKWPHFDKMPVAKSGDIAVKVQGDPADNTNYVNALYEVSAKGEVVGRADGDQAIVIGSSGQKKD